MSQKALKDRPTTLSDDEFYFRLRKSLSEIHSEVFKISHSNSLNFLMTQRRHNSAARGALLMYDMFQSLLHDIESLEHAMHIYKEGGDN